MIAGVLTLSPLRAHELRKLRLPADLFDGVTLPELETYCKRVTVEQPHELRRNAECPRLTSLAAFAVVPGRTVTDNLVDLLVEPIHRINARAERRVGHELHGPPATNRCFKVLRIATTKGSNKAYGLCLVTRALQTVGAPENCLPVALITPTERWILIASRLQRVVAAVS